MLDRCLPAEQNRQPALQSRHSQQGINNSVHDPVTLLVAQHACTLGLQACKATFSFVNSAQQQTSMVCCLCAVPCQQAVLQHTHHRCISPHCHPAIVVCCQHILTYQLHHERCIVWLCTLHFSGHVSEALSSSCAIPRHQQGTQGCRRKQKRPHTSDVHACCHLAVSDALVQLICSAADLAMVSVMTE